MRTTSIPPSGQCPPRGSVRDRLTDGRTSNAPPRIARGCDRSSELIDLSQYAAGNLSDRRQAGLVFTSGLITTRTDEGSARGGCRFQASLGEFDRLIGLGEASSRTNSRFAIRSLCELTEPIAKVNTAPKRFDQTVRRWLVHILSTRPSCPGSTAPEAFTKTGGGLSLLDRPDGLQTPPQRTSSAARRPSSAAQGDEPVT